MAKIVYVRLDSIGTDAGTGFNIYDSLGNVVIFGETAVNLLSGTEYIIDDASTWIEIYPDADSPCSNFIHLDYVSLENNCLTISYNYSGTTFNITVSSFYRVETEITFNTNFAITDGSITATYSVPMTMRINRSTVSATQTVINNGTLITPPVVSNITPPSDLTYNYVHCI